MPRRLSVSSRPLPSSPIDEKEIPIKDTPAYVFPALTPKTAAKTSMGLRRLEASNWLPVDSHYQSEHAIRSSLLSTQHSNVVQCLPGSEQACHEVLDIVVTFLVARYPNDFTISTSAGRTIHNHLTNEHFVIDSTCPNPLEISARLAMEDFNILIKNPETEEYHLMASATLFPAGWKLQERIGTSMANLHKPVPEWKKNLGGSVNRFVVLVFPRLYIDLLLILKIDTSTTSAHVPPWNAKTSSSNPHPISLSMSRKFRLRRPSLRLDLKTCLFEGKDRLSEGWREVVLYCLLLGLICNRLSILREMRKLL